MINITNEETFFKPEDALKEWNFILEDPKIEETKKVEIFAKYGEKKEKFLFFQSTLTSEYCIRDLEKCMAKTFNLGKNLDLKISIAKRWIRTDKQLQQVLTILENSKKFAFLEVSIVEREGPCILCLKNECLHKNPKNSSIKKRKAEEEKENTLNPVDVLSPEINKSPRVARLVNKKRKTSSASLSGSLNFNESMFPVHKISLF